MISTDELFRWYDNHKKQKDEEILIRKSASTASDDFPSDVYLIHQVAVRVQHDGVRGLSGRHVLGRLLQLNALLVGEVRPVMHQLVRVVGVAVLVTVLLGVWMHPNLADGRRYIPGERNTIVTGCRFREQPVVTGETAL